MWPQMRWLISTTGASAHCPKQATVRTVNLPSGVVSISLSAGLRRCFVAGPVPGAGFPEAARSARVAGRAPADADGVVALRLKIEQRVEGRHAEYLRHRKIDFGGDVAQFIGAEVFAGVVLLHRFEDAEQGARAAAAARDHLIDVGCVHI